MTASIFAFPVVLLEGSPFDRGRQHGERFRHEIAAALRRLAAASTLRLAFAAARDKAEAAWPMILSRAPDVAAELQGIADGCGAELTEILLRVGFEFFDAMPPAGCSAIACKGPQGAIVAQNWDAPPTVANELALFVHVGAQRLRAGGDRVSRRPRLGGLQPPRSRSPEQRPDAAQPRAGTSQPDRPPRRAPGSAGRRCRRSPAHAAAYGRPLLPARRCDGRHRRGRGFRRTRGPRVPGAEAYPAHQPCPSSRHQGR